MYFSIEETMVIPEFMAQAGDMVRSIYAPNDPPLLVIDTYQIKHEIEGFGFSNPKWYYILLFPAIDDVIRVSQINWGCYI